MTTTGPTTHTPHTEVTAHTRHAANIPTPSSVTRHTGHVTTSTPGTTPTNDPTQDTAPGPVTLLEAIQRGTTDHPTWCTNCGEPGATHHGVMLTNRGDLAAVAYCDDLECTTVRRREPNTITTPIGGTR